MACAQKAGLIVTITLRLNKLCSLLESVCVCVCVCVCVRAHTSMLELPEGGAVASTGTPNKSLWFPVEGWASGSFLWTVPPFLSPSSSYFACH